MLTAERLRSLLHYDPETGLLTWSVTRRQIRAGSAAGSLNKSTGYIRITVDGADYGAHILAHLYMTGEWPIHQIDHEDLCTTNNKWLNLRHATPGQNCANRGARAENKTGFKGVSFCKQNGKFYASIKSSGKSRNLGYYATPQEASAVYQSALKEIHGDFARAV